jgi:hypothetical protein
MCGCVTNPSFSRVNKFRSQPEDHLLLRRYAATVERDDSVVCRRSLLNAAVACILLGCGSEDRGITQPSPNAVSAVHNTLLAPTNRSLLYLAGSWVYDTDSPILLDLLPYSLDDFTSATSTSIRAVSWQGGYCNPIVPGQPPVVAPRADSTSAFQIWFVADRNGTPQTTSMLYQMTLTAGEAHEAFAFDAHTATGVVYVQNEADCAYYDYTAVLPMPFPVTAGTRYWLQIRAREGAGKLGIFWGWRVGSLDNGISATGSVHGNTLTTKPIDLAFSLEP